MANNEGKAGRFFSGLVDAMGEVTKGAVSDIRNRWEESWFGKEIKPDKIPPGAIGNSDPLGRTQSPATPYDPAEFVDIWSTLDERFDEDFDGMGVDQRAERAEAFGYEEDFEYEPTPQDLGLDDDEFDR